MRIGRRAFLALVAGAAPALAEAPGRTLRPRYRGEWPPPPPPPPSLAQILSQAEVSGQIGVALAENATGRLIEERGANRPLPPASTLKTVTALFALAALGPAHRFATRLLGTGPLRTDGTLEGDLILAGGGDPVLVTDDLASFAATLAATGLRRITGAFRVWGGALPELFEITPGQLPHLAYNPAVSGLNLNFNRVHFEWVPAGGDWQLAMDARSDLYRPSVTLATIRVADRDLPVYTYDDDGGIDRWTVARSALTEAGSRWLPVRRPALYAGEVFRVFATAEGVTLPPPVAMSEVPTGSVLAERFSPPLETIAKDMLEYSTNLTAEVLGLTASLARGDRPETLAQSAAGMAAWLAETHGAEGQFVDHSGLSDASRISPLQMARMLAAPGVSARLQPLLKPVVLLDAEGEALPDPPGQVAAKTGTLNFVTTLAGYVTPRGGEASAFAIFATDPERRAVAQASGSELPDGVRGWNRRARGLQQVLLARWAQILG